MMVLNEEKKGEGFGTHKSVSLGSAGVLVGDDDGLKDVAELLEVGPHALLVRLPRKSPHEHLGEGRVAELPRTAGAGAGHSLRHICTAVSSAGPPHSLCIYPSP